MAVMMRRDFLKRISLAAIASLVAPVKSVPGILSDVPAAVPVDLSGFLGKGRLEIFTGPPPPRGCPPTGTHLVAVEASEVKLNKELACLDFTTEPATALNTGTPGWGRVTIISKDGREVVEDFTAGIHNGEISFDTPITQCGIVTFSNVRMGVDLDARDGDVSQFLTV